MKIVMFEAEDWEREGFAELEKTHEVRFVDEALDAESAGRYPDADIVSTFIYSQLQKETLDQLPTLKMVSTRSTGYDHIDLECCQERGIVVSNVPEYGDHTVAEHVFALLMNISHKMTDAIDRTRRGDFSFRGLRGFDLKGKTFGVIGTGKIGQAAIQIARGFGMHVVAYDVKPDDKAAQSLGYTYVSLDELLRQSDIITLHVPSNKYTHHLLSHDQFEKMKHGVVIINTSRGSVLHTQALVAALASGKVAAAGLDVLQEEPTIREEAELLRSVFHEKHKQEDLLLDHVLLRLRNVYITPHTAFNTREAIQRILKTTVENIDGFLAGAPKNRVN